MIDVHAHLAFPAFDKDREEVIDKARHAGHGTSVNKVLWTEYNGYIVSASDDRKVSIWNFKTENSSEVTVENLPSQITHNLSTEAVSSLKVLPKKKVIDFLWKKKFTNKPMYQPKP